MSTVVETAVGEVTASSSRRFHGREVTPQGVLQAVGMNGNGKESEWTRFLVSGPDFIYDIFSYKKFALHQKKLLMVWIATQGSPAELRLVEAGTAIPASVDEVEVFFGGDTSLWKQRVIDCMQTPPHEDPPSRKPVSFSAKDRLASNGKSGTKHEGQSRLPRRGVRSGIGNRLPK